MNKADQVQVVDDVQLVINRDLTLEFLSLLIKEARLHPSVDDASLISSSVYITVNKEREAELEQASAETHEHLEE